MINYYDWAEYQSKMHSNKIAITDYLLNKKISYKELNSSACKIANYLQAKGIGLGNRVAILSKNHSIFFELQFACSKIGSIMVPLNWRLTANELTFILNDCEPSLLIVDDCFETIADQLRSLTPTIMIQFFSSDEKPSEFQENINGCLSDFERVPLSLDDLIMIMYTSGTTGHPKGAKINHKMQLFNAVNLSGIANLTSKTKQLVILPLFHTGGINCYANPVLHQGGEIIIMREFDPTLALKAIDCKEFAITHLFAVPAPLQFMMQHPDFNTTDFSRLINVGVGGAPCAEIIIKTWQSKGIDVIQGWGMTETSPAGIFLAAEDSLNKIGSAGKAVLHTAINIVNEKMLAVEPNQIGELLIKGPNVTPGYWKNEKATKESFHEGWLKTGDLAKFDEDGFVFIVDREKDMYISGGENVYPAEVENILYQLDEIAELAVIGIPDKKWGETGKLFVVLKEHRELPKEKIIEHCVKNLAKFKIPSEIIYVSELPRNATGKVLKRTLKEISEKNV